MSDPKPHPEAIEAARTIGYETIGKIATKARSLPPLVGQKYKAQMDRAIANVARIITAAYAPRIETMAQDAANAFEWAIRAERDHDALRARVAELESQAGDE